VVRLREQDQQLARLLGQQGLHCSDFDCLDVTEVQLLVNNDSTERFRSSVSIDQSSPLLGGNIGKQHENTVERSLSTQEAYVY